MVSELVVSPSNSTLAIAATQQLTATATYTDGTTAVVTSQATWQSSNSILVSVSATGMVTAVAGGTVTLTATFNGTTGSAQIAVPPAPKTITSIAITPATSTVAVGATQQLTATATYSDQSNLDVSSAATWASSNAALASVSATGLVTGVAPGSVGVTVSLSGVTASAQITVQQVVPPPVKTLTSIAVSPPTANVAVGTTQQLTATATYSDASTANVSGSVTWTSTVPSVTIVNASGLVTGVAAGSAAITASLARISGTAQITVPQPVKTVTSIAVTPSAATVAVTANQQLIATATYSDASTANISSTVTWISSKPSIATASATGLVTGVAAGTATVTAMLSGMSGSAQITVLQPAKTVSSIAVTPAATSIAVGATQLLTAIATYSDNSTANVTSIVTWMSNKTAVATVSPTGLVTGIASGSTIVTASLGGSSGSAQITVPQSAKTVTSIAVTPSGPTVTIGATQRLMATATYNDASTANVSSTVTWTSSNNAAATVNATGLVTGVAAGSATVTASLNAVSGSAQITVPKTLSSVTVTPASPSIEAGATQQFVATATYSDSSTADLSSQASWTSSNQGAATVSPTGLATAVAAGSAMITATYSGMSGSAKLMVRAKTLKSIALTPNPAAIAMGSTQQLTATGSYDDGSTANISATVSWTVVNEAVLAISSSGLATPVAVGSTSVTAILAGISASVAITVTIAPGTGVNISTWQTDMLRSGLNAGETSLTPSNVAPANFGKLFSYQMDGYEYGEPLLMSNVTIGNAAHNVVFAATENDSVYAFDADNYGTGAPLWQVSLLAANETPLTNGPIQPVEGVTSTPVIDPMTNTLYVVSAQTGTSSGPTFRLNALDLTTGAQRPGSPVTIQASVQGTNPSVSVNGTIPLTTACIQRAALLLANGNIYMGFGGCPTGWLLAYDATKLTQVGVFNSSPNLAGEGTYASAGGVWMGSGGPVADSAGNIYIDTGNGPWDGKTAWSNSVIKFNSTLTLQDYFTPDDYAFMNCDDADLAAGGLLMIPGTTQLVGGGKTGKMYLLNATTLGHETANDVGATQTLYFDSGLLNPYSASCTDSSGTHTSEINSYEIFGTAAYYNQSIYLGVTPTGANVPAGIRQFTYSSGVLTPAQESMPSIQEGSYGTTPFISASGTASGIVWMIDHGTPLQEGTPTAAILRAYEAGDLTNQIYNSSTNSSDTPGYGIKFTSPIVGNGKVYMSTGHDNYTRANPHGEIDVFGLK